MKAKCKVVFIPEWGRVAFKLWYGPERDCKQVFSTLQSMFRFVESEDFSDLYTNSLLRR